LNTSAFPSFPLAVQVVFETVPLFPFPDASATADPDPSSNENAATGLGPVWALVVVLVVFE
jgi:hypothetical protein